MKLTRRKVILSGLGLLASSFVAYSPALILRTGNTSYFIPEEFKNPDLKQWLETHGFVANKEESIKYLQSRLPWYSAYRSRDTKRAIRHIIMKEYKEGEVIIVDGWLIPKILLHLVSSG